MSDTIDEQVRTLMFGSQFGDAQLSRAMAAELRERLIAAKKENRPLRVYAGYDPSRPDLHLGHAITMRKLRQFQELGHDVTFVVGTFTAQVGDTSDKTTGRPTLDAERVREAAKTYAEQSYAILDRETTTVAFNGDWLSKMPLTEFATLASNFTVQQFLTRDNYKQRLAAGNPIGLHEFLYALLQGYDAVHLRADVQLGATEQLFNIMAGRKLQEAFGQRPCVCITFPILVGTDGKKRMSKSTGNTVGITEEPTSQYGKIMSITDETMLEWIKYITRWTPGEIEEYDRAVRSGELHPMALKRKLAAEIVSMYHGEDAAHHAAKNFEQVHQQGGLPKDIPELDVAKDANIVDVLAGLESVASRSKARRLIDGGGVRVDGELVGDYEYSFGSDADLLQIGKRRFFKLRHM